MTSKNFLSFNALICFGFSVLLVFIPDLFTSYFTQDESGLNSFGVFLARSYGLLIFAEGLCFWMGRGSESGSQFWRTILYFSLVSNGLTAAMYLFGYLSNVANEMILPIVVFVGGLAIIAAYFLFRKH